MDVPTFIETLPLWTKNYNKFTEISLGITTQLFMKLE
jgi:hypothetical protein